MWSNPMRFWDYVKRTAQQQNLSTKPTGNYTPKVASYIYHLADKIKSGDSFASIV